MVTPKYTDKTRTDWKAEIHDYDKLLALDETYFVSRCLSEPTLAILLGLVTTARWKTRYHSDIDTLVEQLVIDNWYNSAVRELMLDCGDGLMLLRQNPLDSCQLQYSTDGGITWFLAFDYGLCFPPVAPSEEFNTEINITNTINTYVDIYNDGGLTELAPTVEYTEDGDNAYRDMALCYMVSGYVDLCCGAAIEYLSNQSILYSLVSAALGLLAFILAVPTFGLSIWLIAGAAVATASVAILSGIALSEQNVYEDVEARADVVCCMYNALKGQTLTYSIWETSLDACSPELTGNSFEIAKVCKAFFADLEIYLTVIKGEEKALALASSGVILGDCPCIDTWSHQFMTLDFIELCFAELACGSYDVGTGFYVAVVADACIYTQTMGLEVKTTFSEVTNITKVACTFDIVQGAPAVSRNNAIYINDRETTLINQGHTGGGTFTMDTGTINRLALNMEFVLSTKLTSPTPLSSELSNRLRIRHIVIEGKGYDPFEGCFS